MHPTDHNLQQYTNAIPHSPPDSPTTPDKLARGFSPQSIAVIGASSNPAKIGSQILTNIIKGEYRGRIYPINLKAGTIQGLQVYPSVTDIPEPIDHAVVAVPASIVPTVLEECGRKGIPAVTVISAGFKESGEEGATLEKELIHTCKQYDIKLLGPNCLGFINTDIQLNATFSASDARKGHVILFSQSGAFGTAILDWAKEVSLGFKYFFSLGNKAVLDETELLSHWVDTFSENSENIVFAGYLEDIRQGRKFMELASQISKHHPVVIFKPGKTPAALKAISSHTGAMATEDSILNTALRQASCIRVNDIQELFDTIQILSRQSIPRGNKVAIVTNAGGPGVAASDIISETELELATLSETTIHSLSQTLPNASGLNNPIDILGDATAERYDQAIRTTLLDENVDSVIVLLTPQAVTEVEKTASIIAEIYQKYPFKPIVAAFIGGKIIEPGVDILNHSQMPIFTYPRQSIHALSNAFLYRRSLDEAEFKDFVTPKVPTVPLPQPLHGTIVGKESEAFVQSYGIPVPQSFYLQPHDQIPSSLTNQITYPVVAKIISPKVLHKTELKGVIQNINSTIELGIAISQLTKRWESEYPDDPLFKIQVQEMIMDGELVIIGFKRDPNFGPVLLFGSGGIYTELYSDYTQRIAPISEEDARAMIAETKVASILRGYRGKPGRDVDSIVNSLLKLSAIAIEHPDISEFDINPYIVNNEGLGGYAVDVKIVIEKTVQNNA